MAPVHALLRIYICGCEQRERSTSSKSAAKGRQGQHGHATAIGR